MLRFAAARRQVFVITWITYAGFYFCRKNLGIVLPMLHEISGLRSSELANVVFGYSWGNSDLDFFQTVLEPSA